MRSEWATTSSSCRGSGPEFATGVTGKECVLFADKEKTLVRENDLELEGLSWGSVDVGVSGMRRTVFSHSGGRFFVLKLRCRFLIDGLPFAELGLGGKLALVELGLVIGGILILVELGHGFSMVLDGICSDDRFGRLGCEVDGISPSFSVCLQAYKTIQHPEYAYLVNFCKNNIYSALSPMIHPKCKNIKL